MRFYFKKAITLSAGTTFFVCFVVLNYETQQQRVAYSSDTPWGKDFHPSDSSVLTGDSMHRHILESVYKSTDNHNIDPVQYVPTTPGKHSVDNDTKTISGVSVSGIEDVKNISDRWFVYGNVTLNNFDDNSDSRGSEKAYSINGTSRIWYDSENENDDRIISQMEYTEKGREFKTILIHQGFNSHVRAGQRTFIEDQCPTNKCILTTDKSRQTTADAVLFHQGYYQAWYERPPNQVWILYLLESPYHTPSFSSFQGVNWTATYRHDSILVTPYERFRLYDESVVTKNQTKNYAKGKTKKVAWFVSNCAARNGRREYATELSKYIQVDIYGACGPLKCFRRQGKCFDMLNNDYKFYLSFENSNCRDYITEKFFVNGLGHDVIPVAMGAPKADYLRIAPQHSFIHVDDFESPKELAEYLQALDKNDTLYNEYFQWKGTGRFINTLFWCRLCGMVHAKEHHAPVSYNDINSWWRGEGICIGNKSWRTIPSLSIQSATGER